MLKASLRAGIPTETLPLRLPSSNCSFIGWTNGLPGPQTSALADKSLCLQKDTLCSTAPRHLLPAVPLLQPSTSRVSGHRAARHRTLPFPPLSALSTTSQLRFPLIYKTEHRHSAQPRRAGCAPDQSPAHPVPSARGTSASLLRSCLLQHLQNTSLHTPVVLAFQCLRPRARCSSTKTSIRASSPLRETALQIIPRRLALGIINNNNTDAHLRVSCCTSALRTAPACWGPGRRGP